MKKAVYSFMNKASIGINKIPKNSLVEIENYNGLNESLLLTIKKTENLNDATTIEDFLVLEDQYQVYNQNFSKKVQKPKTFQSFKDVEIVDIDTRKGDALIEIDLIENTVIIAEPLNIEYGNTGIIEIINTQDKDFLFEKGWNYQGTALATVFEYIVLPSGKIILKGLY